MAVGGCLWDCFNIFKSVGWGEKILRELIITRVIKKSPLTNKSLLFLYPYQFGMSTNNTNPQMAELDKAEEVRSGYRVYLYPVLYHLLMCTC
jgi:hypothetical protein